MGEQSDHESQGVIDQSIDFIQKNHWGSKRKTGELLVPPIRAISCIPAWTFQQMTEIILTA